MIRKLAAVLCACVLSISMTGCSLVRSGHAKVTHKTEVPPKMLFLGDSIAAGYGLEGYTSTDNYNCNSYSNILKERYDSELNGLCGHTMVNKAISGATSQDLIDLLNSGDLDVDLTDSDAIVISIGGNDMLGILFQLFSELGFSAESHELNLDDIDILSAASALYKMDAQLNDALNQFQLNLIEISDIIHEKTEGVIYIQTLYDPLEYFSDYEMVTSFSSKKIAAFNSIISDNATDRYIIADVFSAFKGKNSDLTNMSRFDIHPNAEGHKVIAEVVDTAFRETGFTYITYEYGPKKLTAAGISLICGGFVILASAAYFSIKRIGSPGKAN